MRTRKSSCVLNARGIPTAAYQVLPRWGTPLLGYPLPGLMGGYLRWGTPQPGLMGGTPEVGYPPIRVWLEGTQGGVPPSQVWQGVPKVQYSPLGYPRPGLTEGYPPARSDGGGGYLRWGTPRPGLTGVPEVGYPPPPVGVPPGCGQTEGQTRVKT